MLESPAGGTHTSHSFMFSLGTVPRESRQIKTGCGFQGQRMFIWILRSGQPVAAERACICIRCICIYI